MAAKTSRVAGWSRSPRARKRDYWTALIKGTREMTTNDIDVVAKAFGLPTPFDYVRNAHELAETGGAPTFNVGTHPEDYDISETRASTD
ncbi:hypothetical protein HR12_42960 [Microbacterium sp. SUBG005]|nr:hypothetical protein HR12_42960 [Microbacterium sp. SUBG005]